MSDIANEPEGPEQFGPPEPGHLDEWAMWDNLIWGHKQRVVWKEPEHW